MSLNFRPLPRQTPVVLSELHAVMVCVCVCVCVCERERERERECQKLGILRSSHDYVLTTLYYVHMHIMNIKAIQTIEDCS